MKTQINSRTMASVQFHHHHHHHDHDKCWPTFSSIAVLWMLAVGILMLSLSCQISSQILVINNDTNNQASLSHIHHNNVDHHHHHHHNHWRHYSHLTSNNNHKRRDTSSSSAKNDHHNSTADNGAHLKSYTTSNKSINFTHIEFDSTTGTIYVGASNWIFQLDSDTLRVEHAVRTGPIRDSPICPPSDCSSVNSNLLQITNNVNKILLVEPYARMLIVCGSVHQGACTRHRLEDISQHEDLVPLPVASNDENCSTIAFVGPARYFGVQLTPILYVAATDSRLGPYRDMVPAISGRSLESSRLFTIIDRGFADSARVDISSNLRDYFLVHYVYGFYANDYVYFAQVQRRSYLRTLEEMGYATSLSRVCVSDAGFHTYTELTLQCYSSRIKKQSSTNGHHYHHNHPQYHRNHPTEESTIDEFNLLQDAILIKAGADLCDSMNIERGSLVLIGVFANSHDHTNRANGGKSAICIYPIIDIEQRFAENIHLCYNGSVYSRNMDYIAGSVNQCPEPGAGNVFNFCNEAVKLNGSIPLRTQASIVYDDGHTILTSIAAGVTGQHTVAFVGTNYGSIKKVLLTRANHGHQFDEIEIDHNQPILADMFVDNDQNPRYVIAASPYKVTKFAVETCLQHNTCDQCLEARNPYCGWCSLQKRCTIKSECLSHSAATAAAAAAAADSKHHSAHHYTMLESKSSLFSTPRWLSLETSQCIDFQAIKPEFMSRNIVAPVELIINQLPPLPYGANYLCVFEQQGEPIPATVTRNGLICQTPSIQLRPKIPNGHDHVSVDVAVRSSETDTDFIHRRFIYFDCSVHRSCKSCVMSAWDCNWCMHQNLCTNNASSSSSSCTRRMKNENNVHSNSLIKSVQHCPSFDIQQEILIPDGRSHQLSVEIKNLMPIFANGFECIVEIEQAKERVEARISDNKIICNELLLSYEEQIGQQQAQLTVLWNSDTLIDRTNFTIYKCQYLGAYAGRVDCSLCQTRDDKFNCVWCQNQCIFNDDCNDLSIINTCPPPRIDYIHPISGPVEGGTLVSIEGSNLGSSFDEIKDRISIGGIPCQPIEYNISIRVVCRTGPSLIGPQSALVVIGNRAGVSRAQEKFQYKIITLIDVNPKIGPQSGGTRIYLSGKNLNIGSNVAIYLDDLPCIVERSLASSFQMSCRTSAAPYSSYVVTSLTLMIDGANYSLSNPFLYTSDPIIDRIEPLQSFFSGGRMITVIGSQFTSIQQPRMLVFVPRSTNNNNIQQQQQQQTTKTQKQPVWSSFNDVHMMMNVQSINEQSNDQYRLINESLCTVISSIKMICQSPMINGDLESLANNLSNANQQHHHHHHNHQQQHHRHNSTLHHIPNQIYLQIGFIMDDTISALHLDIYYPNLDSRMLYVSDPSIYSINNGHGKSIMIDRDNSVEQGILPFDGDVIIIEGENLAVLLLSENELNVTIGQQRCNITSVNMRQIVCQPPKYPPASTDELGRRTTIELPAIVLKIGNMRRNLGYLHYLNYFYDSFNSQTSDERDDTSRFYHQNHPPYNSYGNRFESISNTINVELLIVVCILIGTILTIISIIILAAYKHKTNEAEREYKRIQLQMDTLENNVRSECKQAFAELQTDILHANGLLGSQDLSKISLPTHDERTFLLRMFLATGTTLPSMSLSNSASTLTSSSKENQTIDQQSNFVINNLKAYHNLYDVLWNWSPFFKNDDDSTSPNDFDYQYNDDERKSVTIVLEQFHQLLLNRTFLLTLINTLEQHTKTVQERMRFASLLMITLLDRMEYSFDIMRHLLAKLIDRYALGKHMHHNQSIKRNETIAEKMLIDWLAICLFKYAREISSMPFFLMYSAIKHQIDKGPVDYVTGNSRYSLSEDKLLREQIDYKTLTVNVLLDHKLQQALPLSIVRFSGNTKHRNCILMPTTLSTNRLKKSSDHHSNVNNNSDELQSQDSNVNNNYGRTSGDQTTSSTDVTTATVTDNKEYDCEYYPIRILDCDTITQVKMKIIDSLFRYVANHERPSISDLQLSWRCYKPKQSATSQQPSNSSSSSSSSSSTSSSIHNPNSTLRMTTTTNNNNNNCDYNGTEASFNSDQSPSRMMNMMMINNNNNNTNNNINKQQSSTLVYQDVYGVASLMSKNDADKIYNASRRSDLSMEMSDIILDDYDHSTQIMTANEAIWRRLNTISHYGIGEGAVLVLSIKSSNKLSPTYKPTSVYEKQCLMNGDEQQQPVTIGNDYPTLYNSNVNDDSSEFHLYEQIPADRNSFYGCNTNQDVVVVENVYNLSQASSSLKPSMNMHFAASAQQSYQQIYGIGNMPNPYKQLRLSSQYRPSTITSNHHRSFARNVYDRLSLFMRSNTSPKRSKHHHHHHHHHNHSFQINQRTFQNSNIFNSNNNNHINELHNVWHLVKPSSLIADCAFDPDSIKSSYNLRTMRQRRAFKRRQRQCAFMKTNRKCTSSSCQVNLDQMANMFNNSVSMNSLAINSPMPVATAATTAPNDSMLNTSASSLLSSLFCSDSQQQRQHQQQQQQQQQQQSNISTYLMHRSIPEIYLTRLLTTKGTIQQYVDDFFQTIFTVDQHLPIAIKWLFDFLDNSITDTNTLIRWKNDSLILPFWVSMIRMPEILFDIQTNSSIDVCLEVLAKNLIDSCQWNKENSNNGGVTNIGGVGGNNNNNCHTQTAKDCPSSKLLCARDVARYQQMISQYYKDISLLPPINEGDIFAYMNDVSKTFEGKVQKDKAIYELLTYCLNYKEQIYQSLIINETNNNAQHPQQQQQLDRRFETIIYAAMATINMNESSSSKNNGQHQQQQHQQQHQPTAVAEQQQQHQRSRV